MHLLGISLLLAYLLYTNLASDFSHSDYDYYEQEQRDEPVSCVCMHTAPVCKCFNVSPDTVSAGVQGPQGVPPSQNLIHLHWPDQS